ncbi:MAG: O-antigen/teichoic acid export membrane protein [Planctomycetota bacterium]|jgi:O-antigen/teichoic acid export membrane protein
MPPADRQTPEPSSPEGAGKIGSLLRHSAIYSLVPIFANVISLVMLAFMTDWLHQDEMGLNAIIDLVLAFSLELLGVSALEGMVRFYFEHKNQRDRNAVVSSSILLGSGVAWLVCGVCWFFSDTLRPILLAAPTEVLAEEYLNQVFALALLLVPFQMTTQAGFRFLMINHQSGLFAGIQSVKMLVELALKIWFVAPPEAVPFGLGMGVKGILLSVLVGEVITSTSLTFKILGRIGWRMDWKIFKPVVIYSTPLVVAALFHLALQRSDLRLIELLLPAGVGLGAAGIYGIGYKIGRLANQLLLGPFLQIFLPWIYAVEDDLERTDLIARVTTYLLVIIGAAVIVLSCFARELILTIDWSEGHSYEPAYKLVPLVAGSYVFWALYKSIGETSFYVAKRTNSLSALAAIALAFNVGLNFWLIPEYGIIGAAVSTIIAYAVLALLGEWGRHMILKHSMNYRRIGLCLGIVAVACSLAMFIDQSFAVTGKYSLTAIGLKLPLALVSILSMWQFVLMKSERQEFTSWVRSRLNKGTKSEV